MLKFQHPNGLSVSVISLPYQCAQQTVSARHRPMAASHREPKTTLHQALKDIRPGNKLQKKPRSLPAQSKARVRHPWAHIRAHGLRGTWPIFRGIKIAFNIIGERPAVERMRPTKPRVPVLSARHRALTEYENMSLGKTCTRY